MKNLNSVNYEERIISKLIIYKIISSSINSRKDFLKIIGYFFNSQIYDEFCSSKSAKIISEREELKYFYIEEMLDLLSKYKYLLRVHICWFKRSHKNRQYNFHKRKYYAPNKKRFFKV